MSKKPIPIKDIQQEKKIFQSRVFFAMGIVILFFILLTARYAYLQFNQHEHYNTVSDQNRIRLQALAPARGYIYDRNGILLADNYPVFSAVINKSDLKDNEHIIGLLTPILKLSPEDIESFEKRAKSARKTEILAIKMNLTEEEIARFSEVKQKFPGIRIETQMTRYYPHGDLFAHVVGYVGRINDKDLKIIDKDAYAGTNLIGKVGVEKSYEHLLHGKPGFESVEADAYSNVLRHLGRQEAIRGNDLYLSLDYGLQVVASQQLAGRRGAIVAMNPNTGEILALVSSPSFNPNLFVTGISHTDYRALSDNIDQPLYNRAVQGVYPPGSTIKPMFGLGGIHYGYVNWGTAISDPGYFHLPGDSHRFRDHKKTGHGSVNMHKAQVVSCDTYFYVLSYQMGIEKMHDWMSQFGFGKKTGVDLPSESSGLYPDPDWKMRTRGKKWLKGETISVSIGQGAFTATPLQLARATAITANFGQHVTPHVLYESKGATKHHVHNGTLGKIDFNGKEEDWSKMRDAMIDVIQSGTGKGIKGGLQYQIAGKTGTAQVKSIAQGKRYNEALLTDRQLDHGLFVGFAPADKPEIVLSIILENGRGGSAATALARPIFDYWIVKREKEPVKPAMMSGGGLMTAGLKPSELPTNNLEQASRHQEQQQQSSQR